MKADRVHYRHMKCFYFTGKSINKICTVYDKCAIAERTVWTWFSKFKYGDFDLEYQHSGRPSITDES